MSFFKVTPNDVNTFSVVTNPQRSYVSSSTAGSTGSVYVFARRSPIEKEVAPVSSFVESVHNDVDIESTLRGLQGMGRYAMTTGSSSGFVMSASLAFPGMLSDYMTAVNSQRQSVKKQKVLEIVRFTPTINFTENTVKKLVIKENLSHYYRTVYPSSHWVYSNYHSLNFFTSSTVPTSSCLMYPNILGGPVHEGHVSGTYALSGAFTFDFYINPRYRPDSPNGEFKAGTIYHLSSTYAVSLVTGSAKDENGLPLGFRVQLQLSHSADIPPSLVVPNGNRASSSPSGYAPSDLVFLSDDNSLKWNRWHHVVVRWGTNLTNFGTGSFNIDAVDRGYFVIPSSSISPMEFSGTVAAPDVLFVGNYYEGLNSGYGLTSRFFGHDPATRDGLNVLDDSSGFNEPSNYYLRHPLNAEVHDLAIKRYYMTDADIDASASMGPKAIDSDWVAFYLPPFFTEESPLRQSVGGAGGVLQTPFFEIDGTTNDPFNVAMAFGVNGHYINLENFVKDFASDQWGRTHHMSGVALESSTDAQEANVFLYDQPMVRRRNLFIMPCDDGLFVPAYELLASESMRSNAVDDLGLEELSFIHLDNMLSTSSLLFQSDFGGDTSYADEVTGYTPEQPGLSPGKAVLQHKSTIDRSIANDTFDPGIQDGAPLTIYQRTRDPSSNQVTFFDISNLYYGKRILPGSVVLMDSNLTGSGGKVSITLKDDGRGTLYRSDSITSASTWNSVGTVYYDEGIIVIKSPHLYFFGKEGFEISFRGTQNVHVMTVDVNAPANQLNSSSNPNYQLVPPSPFPNDPEKEFVYISAINFHDENFNIVMKTQLAQPIMKRPGDRMNFRVKYDF